MFLLYDLIFFIFSIIYLPYLAARKKWHRGFYARLGRVPAEIRGRLGGRRHIWFHAVSVGEALAVVGLVEKFKKQYPHIPLIISTVTTTGYELAKNKLGDAAVVIFAPLDFSWVVKKYIKLINPLVYITAETEIWPNLFSFLFRHKVPIAQVNGRISDKSYGRYQRGKFLLRPILQKVSVFCMQSETDAQRIISLGAQPDRVFVVGNMKFDNPTNDVDSYRRRDLGYDQGDCVLIAGSTHPGEEAVILKTYLSLKTELPRLRVMLVPRHIERVEEIKRLVEGTQLRPVPFSTLKKQSPARALLQDDIVIVDTVGDLAALYNAAEIVFIGKSLMAKGGQNIIEPALFSKPIVVGPHMENFRTIQEEFLKHEAVVQIFNQEELTVKIRELAVNEPLRTALGQKARGVVTRHQGATQKCFDHITRLISNFSTFPQKSVS